MENEEKWRAVVEFEGLYEVSSIGRVRSLDRVVRSGRLFPGRILRQRRDSRGYMHVNLWRDRRMTTMRVHRLVLIAFAGAPEGPVEGCHNDGDPSNNRIQNLRWDTHRENLLDAMPDGTSRTVGECMRGHRLEGANLTGSRWCRACARERRDARRAGRPFDNTRAAEIYAEAGVRS